MYLLALIGIFVGVELFLLLLKTCNFMMVLKKFKKDNAKEIKS
jgi:hypothetical protein